MIKTLKPIGNSLGLVIDKPILELLEIDRTTRLELKLEGNRLYIEPLAPERADLDTTNPTTNPAR